MNERCRNLCIHIGLVPLALCSICILADWILNTFPEDLAAYPKLPEDTYSFFDDETEAATRHLQIAFAFHAVLLLLLMGWLWRPYIRWTTKKAIGSKLLLMPLVLQLIIFQPLIETRCNFETQKQLSVQTGVAYSLFRIGAPILLWGFASVTVGVVKNQHRGSKKMTGNAVRLLVGIGCLVLYPLLILFILIGLELFDDLVEFDYNPAQAGATACALSCIVVGLIWVGVWRSAIRFTSHCQVLTGFAFLIFIFCSGSLLFINEDYWVQLLAFGLGFWFISTGIIWSRFRRHSQVVDGDLDIRPTCPACQYLLTGLAAARCPECGWAGNLEDVICVTADV